MKSSLFFAAILALSLASSHAVSTEKPDAEKPSAAKSAAEPDAATLKKQLIAAINADIKALEKDGPDGSNAERLTHFLTLLDDPVWIKRMESNEGLVMDPFFSAANPSRQTRNCYTQWIVKIKQDAEQATQKLVKELPDTYRSALNRAINAQSPKEVDTISNELTATYNALSTLGRRSVDSSISHHSFISLLEQIKIFHTAMTNKDLPRATNQFSQITQTLRNYSNNNNLTTEEQNNAYLEVLRKRAGIPNAKEIENLSNNILNELLDDKNQDRLDEITEQIRQQQSITSNSSSSYDSKANRSWQALYSLATSLSRNVSRIKNGGVSQFSVDRWQSDEGNNKSLMPTKELNQRLKSYQVRVTDENGKPSTQPLIYNIREILDSIHSLADLRQTLPTLKKASQYQSNTGSDGFEWSQPIAAMDAIALVAEKLDSGNTFPLASEMGYYGESRRFPAAIPNHPATATITALTAQLQHRILRRFHPEIPTTDTTEPSKIIDRLLEKAKTEKQYQEIINLTQLTSYFNPGQSTISTKELVTITCMLAGLRQDDELSQPRLATYYFQKAADSPSAIVPIEDLKKRLQHLKTSFPDDYAKGTDDFLKSPTDDLNRHSYPTQLIVPEKK